MTAPEYVQLKAFARIDGALLSVMWVFCFLLYVLGLSSPAYGMGALLLAVATPFFVGYRLRQFRDVGLGGSISLLRAWAYTVFVFFYGSLLFAVALWAYFTYIDQGYLIGQVEQMLGSSEVMAQMQQMGMGEAMTQSIELLRKMRPIDLAVNMLTSNLMIGAVVGLPIAALMRRERGMGHNKPVA